jgi:hypothetical protein
MLNRALRNLEGDTIINMGFLIHDLHRQIEGLDKEQVSSYHGKPFFVYRGQGLSTTDFDKLQKTKGGLMSFNNFLSTSKVRDISLGFAKGALGKKKKKSSSPCTPSFALVKLPKWIKIIHCIKWN